MTRVVLIPMASLVIMAGCSKQDEPREPNPAEDAPTTTRPVVNQTGPKPQVVFEIDGTPTVTVEVVRKQSEIRRGLMYRTHLPADAGMLFLFKREKIQSFYMKNTLISLDMIFIRADMTVAGIRANTPPRTLDSQRVKTPSQFVLEVNAGWAEKHGVVAGSRARFENIENVPPGVKMEL